MKSNKLLEDIEKRLGALRDCQSKLRLEEQDMRTHIGEIKLKKNTLTDEHETASEQKVCCMSHLCKLANKIASSVT